MRLQLKCWPQLKSWLVRGSVYKKAHSQLWVGGLRSLPRGSFQKTAQDILFGKAKDCFKQGVIYSGFSQNE